MTLRIATLAVFAALALPSCRSSNATDTATSGPHADIVFTGGTVHTVDDANPRAEAVAVRDNRIVYVGSAEGARDWIGDDTRTIDCTGKTVMPGFVSAHDHLIASSWTSLGVNLYDAKDKAETLQLIKEYADAHPDEEVIRGIGWVASKLGGPPTAKELDTVVPDRPAILLDFTIHDGWLNTKALEMGGVTKDTPDTLPGVTYWVRDEEGNPTGAAIEIQWMQTYIDIGAWDAEKMMRESADTLFTIAAQNGTTTILNPGVVTPNVKDTHGGMERDFEAAMQMLAGLEAAGELKLRVQALPFFKNGSADPDKFAAFAARMKAQYQGEKLRCDFVKIHPDGNWNAEVSPFLEPYRSGKTGTFNVGPELMAATVLACNAEGLGVVIHTDGTATARAAIDAILASREAGHSDERNTIHHLPWVHPDDYARIVEHEIPINATPSFTNAFGDVDKDSVRLLGKERVDAMLGRYTDLPNDGVRVSISADVPSTQPSMQAPLFCVEGAVTLLDATRAPSESQAWPPTRAPMTVDQAIRAITIDAAWQLGMDESIGSLEVGKLADIVVLEQDPFEVEPTMIEEIDVAYTMMDGRFTHSPSDVDLLPEDDDHYLDTNEITPAAWYGYGLQPKEVKALNASLAFARRECCGAGEAHQAH